MKSNLFIAGDSFACISKSQELGISWSELVANELDFDLNNYSIPGSSNESICLQIDYITEQITSNDIAIIFLTDSFRKTFSDPTAEMSAKHLLKFHALQNNQRYIGSNIYSEKPHLHSWTHVWALTDDAKNYFKKYYNYNFQKFVDKTLITGVLAKLKSKTNKFVVFSGGFNDGVYRNPIDINAETFCIEKYNFNNLSSDKILKLGTDNQSANHISIEAHQKVSRLILNAIAGWRSRNSSGS